MVGDGTRIVDEKIFLMRRIWIILILLMPMLTQAQSLKKANKKSDRGEYELAIARYEKLVKNPKYAGNLILELPKHIGCQIELKRQNLIMKQR